MGKNDVVQHCKSKSHLNQVNVLNAQPKLSFQALAGDDLKRTEAELQLAVLTASCNVHDRLSPMIRKIFPDSNLLQSTILLPQKLPVC